MYYLKSAKNAHKYLKYIGTNEIQIAMHRQ